ncbi:MAG: hypothetical protein ACYSTZ_00120 [Planctomycetota bacterium]|jgi:hypothetical protein
MKCSSDFIVAYNELMKTLTDEQREKFWPIFSDTVLGRLRHLVRDKGFLGMLEYWSDTLLAEHADCIINVDLKTKSFLIIMRECPSIKLLGETVFDGYCSHCHKLYKPLLASLGYSFQISAADCGCEIFIQEQS